MGLEILEEFRPITPIRTITKTLKHVSEVETTNYKVVPKVDEEECHTPTSQPQSTKNCVCPPAPKKARVTRSNNSASPSQGFFQVPHDLPSVFLFRTPNLPATRSEIALTSKAY